MILNEDEMNAQEVPTIDYKALFIEFLDTEEVVKKQDDYYVFSIYADYNDYIGAKDAREIISSEHPEEAFDDIFSDSDMYAYAEDDLFRSFGEYLRKKGIEKPSRDDEWELRDLGNISYEMDYNHYFNQKYKARIIVDTGDGNYDFTLNPSYYNEYQGANGLNDEYKIGKPASLAWLAETQGYSIEQLQAALSDEDVSEPNGFLQSVRQEAINVSSSMNALTFLVKATLKQMMDWKQFNGSITIPANCKCCGLYDAWNGGGSTLEIELEKPVTIPAEYIREFNVDEDGDGMYSVNSVYGLSGEAYNTEVSIDNSTNEALNEAEMKMNAQGRMRPTTYKSHMAHKTSNKPLSLQVYDGLEKLKYIVYASTGRYGYKVAKCSIGKNKRGGDTYDFIRNEAQLDKAIDLCNNLNVEYDIKKNYDGTYELLTRFIDDSDEVEKYFRSTDRTMQLESIISTDEVKDADLDKLIQDITAKCHEQQIGLQEIWKDGLFIDAIIEGDWKHDHWCFEDIVRQIYPKVRISQQKVWSTGEDFYKAQYSIFAHPLVDDFEKLFAPIDESVEGDKIAQDAIDSKNDNFEKDKQNERDCKLELAKNGINESLKNNIFNKLDGKSVEEINQLIDEYQDAIAYEHDEDPNTIVIDCASSETEEKIVKKFRISGYDYCDSPVDHEIYIRKNKQAVLDKFYEVNDFGFDSNLVDIEHVDNKSVSYRFNGQFDIWYANENKKEESLKENLNESNENNGLTSIANSLIQNTWQSIQQTNDAIVNFNSEGRTDLTEVLQNILDEQNIHVGKLETLLKELDTSAENIDTGKEQLVTEDINAKHEYSVVGKETSNGEQITLKNTDEFAIAAKKYADAQLDYYDVKLLNNVEDKEVSDKEINDYLFDIDYKAKSSAKSLKAKIATSSKYSNV